VEDEIAFKWCDKIPSKPKLAPKPTETSKTAENRIAFATQQRQFIERRLNLHLQMNDTDGDEEYHDCPRSAENRGCKTTSKPSRTTEIDEILSTIDHIDQQDDTQRDQESWLEFKGLMQTLSQIKLI